MGTVQIAPGEIARRGATFYEQTLKAILEPHHNGKYLVLDVDSGDYELDKDFFAAVDRAKSRFGRTRLYSTRVGFGSLCRIGGRFKVISR